MELVLLGWWPFQTAVQTRFFCPGRFLSSSFPSPLAHQLYMIHGAKETKEGKECAIGIQTPDEKTLVVQLEYPEPSFLEILSTPIAYPVPQKAEENKKSWCSEINGFICNGPFYPKEWKHHDFIIALKNPQYWDEKNVKLPSLFFVMVSPDVELSMFENGSLDWAGSPLSTLPLDAIRKWKTSPLFSTALYSGTVFLRVNMADGKSCGLLGEKNARKALSLAIDRFSVEKMLPGGQKASLSLVPSELLFFQKNTASCQEADPYFQQGI